MALPPRKILLIIVLELIMVLIAAWLFEFCNTRTEIREAQKYAIPYELKVENPDSLSFIYNSNNTINIVFDDTECLMYRFEDIKYNKNGRPLKMYLDRYKGENAYIKWKDELKKENIYVQINDSLDYLYNDSSSEKSIALLVAPKDSPDYQIIVHLQKLYRHVSGRQYGVERRMVQMKGYMEIINNHTNNLVTTCDISTYTQRDYYGDGYVYLRPTTSTLYLEIIKMLRDYPDLVPPTITPY